MTKSKAILCNKEKLLNEEKERLRKLRIIQVREISKQNAAILREEFRKEKEKEIKALLNKQNHAKELEKEENMKKLEQVVQKELFNIGNGHLQAANYLDQNEFHTKRSQENDDISNIRGKIAMELHREERKSIENKENAHIIARKFAIDQEKIRSKEILKSASQPKINKIASLKDDSPKVKLVSYDANSLMTTRLHMPDVIVVDKTNPNDIKQDARFEANEEEARSKLIQNDINRMSHERMEKARLRGKHAIEKELMNQNYNQILHDLSDLQKLDRERRQKELINIPKDVFVPIWQQRKYEINHQNNMEKEFEKLYSDKNIKNLETNKSSDLKEPEISQSDFQDADLDLTIIDNEIPSINSDLNENIPVNQNDMIEKQLIKLVDDKNLESEITKSITASSTIINNTNDKNKSVFALSKILEKIQKQREEYKEKSARINNDISVTDQDSLTDSSSQESSIIEINKHINALVVSEREIIPADIESISNCSSTKSTITSVNVKAENNVIENQVQQQKDKEKKKVMRGIMMSSHNVSSLNEFQMLDSNKIELNAKLNYVDKNISRNDYGNDNDKINGQANNINKYGIDMSHVSRDSTIAGSKELFNKNNVKFTIQMRQKHLVEKQLELEKKLKQLEEQEIELEKENFISSNNTLAIKASSVESKQDQDQMIVELKINNNQQHTVAQSTSAGPDSGNDHNYNSDDTTAISNTIIENNDLGLSSEDLKRIQYQQSLLKKMNTTKPLSKITDLVKSDNYSLNETSSGFGSSLVSIDSAALLIEQRKREILKTFGLESNENLKQQLLNQPQLVNYPYADKFTNSSSDSGIVSIQSANNNNMGLKPCHIDTRSTDESSKQIMNNKFKQQQYDLLNYVNGVIDQDEYKQRLSANLTFLYNSNIDLSKCKNVNKLFGLDLFDESDNLRDKSIEKIISISLQNINSMKPSAIKSNLIQNLSLSLNDTLNDQDQDSSFNNNLIKKNNNYDTEDDESEDDISKDLLISLLNNRQSRISNKNSQQISLIEMKKNFIQSQLDSVQRQKEQLLNKNNRLLSQIPTQPPPPSIKIHHKFASELNSHELSTIKEVDTPISERNVRLINRYKNINNELSTSLESLTQLTNEKSSSSSSSSSTSSTSIMSSINDKNNEKSVFSSSSTPISSQTPYHNPQLLDIDQIRQKQKELFNFSLFDSTNSINSDISSLTPPKNIDKNIIQYGAMIFDSLSSTNLSISCSNTNNLTELKASNSTLFSNNNNNKIISNNKQKVAFISESTNSDDISINNSSINSSLYNYNNINTNKKINILTTSTEEENNIYKSKNEDQNITTLSQHPIDSSNEEDQSNILNVQELEKTLQPVQNDTHLPKSIELSYQEKSSIMQTLSSTSNTSMTSSRSSISSPSGMFDKFLKNYTSQTIQSVMDEPEISFVSDGTAYSTTNSPKIKNEFKSGFNILIKNSSKSIISNSNTSFSSNTTSCIDPNETTSYISSSNNSNLIQYQQKHLCKKFANMSPIETNSSSNDDNPKFLITNSSIKSNCTLLNNNQTNKNIENEENKSTQSSLILLSPNKIYNEKSTSLVHGLINDDENEETSQSFIEGALQAPFEFNKFQNINNINNQSDNDYLSDSLISFEHHELSQLTHSTIDLKQYQIKSRSNSVNSNGSIFNDDTQNNNFFDEHTQDISKMFENFREKFGSKTSFLTNSTPKIAIGKSYQSSITNVTNDNLQDEEITETNYLLKD